MFFTHFQSNLIESIKLARQTELKTMLNNVPVGGSSIGYSGNALQYLGAAVVTILIGFGIYYFWPSSPAEQETTKEEVIAQTPIEKETEEKIDNPAQLQTTITKEKQNKNVKDSISFFL